MANLREEQERLANPENSAQTAPEQVAPHEELAGSASGLTLARLLFRRAVESRRRAINFNWENLSELLQTESTEEPVSLALDLKIPSSTVLLESWVKNRLPASEIAGIKALAVRVFDDEAAAIAWLQEPNLATDSKPPVSLLGTSGGYERVQNLLLRIQYGVLA